MYKEILQSISGIELYAIVAMVIFILFFVGMAIWVIKVDKKYIKRMSELPIEEDKNEISNLAGGTNEN
ncbi:MAG: cbb3-type cytochrome c oxidase subunit 3 [Ignavibacterium sp.]|nr:MAG: cbb3-type cytochrome c oxidase subunit 3 [Ignavibacterium sp.]